MGPGSNGEVDMVWMMAQASPIFLTDVNRTLLCYQMHVCVMLFYIVRKKQKTIALHRGFPEGHKGRR